MPARDGTGPDGEGARTGRGLGNYSDQGGPESGYGDRRGLRRFGGRGLGLGGGRGLGPGGGRGLGRGGGRGLGGRGMGMNARQGNFWWQAQLSDLQATIEKLMARLGRHEEVN